MSAEMYRYCFAETADLKEVEALLVMAFLGAEALHGESQVRMDASHALDQRRRSCVIDAATEVGRDINRLFTGYLQREFGLDQFSVRRIERRESEVADVAA